PDTGGDGWSGLAGLALELLAGASWMTVSGSLPVGAPADGYARLIEAAAATGVPAALDSRDEALALGVAARPRVVKVNTEEAGTLLGRGIRSLDDARDSALRILGQAGGDDGRIAIVTRGAEGAVVATGGPEVLHGRLYERGPYPVGSGDAFLAGFVTVLDAGGPVREALRLALGAGTANAEIPGA